MSHTDTARLKRLRYLHRQKIYNRKNKFNIAKYQIGYREINRDKLNKYASNRYKNTRKKVLCMYTDGDTIRCACHGNGCKERRIKKMVIEHNKGKDASGHEGMSNVSYYTEILKTKPNKLSVTCQRCNASKRDGNVCRLHGTRF